MSETVYTIPPPPDGAPPERRRQIFFAVSGLLLIAILAVFREVLLPFLLALVVAFVFAPVVARLERVRMGRRALPRWAAVLLLYLTLLGALGASVAIFVPRLIVELQDLIQDSPKLVEEVRTRWLPAIETRIQSATEAYGTANQAEAPPAEEIPRSQSIRVTPSEGGYVIDLPDNGVLIERRGEQGYRIVPAGQKRRPGDLTKSVQDALRDLSTGARQDAASWIEKAQAFINAVVRGVFGFFIMLMLSAYLLLTKDRILGFFRSLVDPVWRHNYDRLLERIEEGLGGVVRGQLIICVVNGVLSGIGFYLLELKYWPILTLIATVLSIVPIFGSILSSVPAVLIALQSGLWTALFTLAWILGIHQLEANLLNPKIMGDSAKVHPVLVVFALLAGEHLFGAAGALLAVPTLSILQSLFLHYRDVALDPSAAE